MTCTFKYQQDTMRYSGVTTVSISFKYQHAIIGTEKLGR